MTEEGTQTLDVVVNNHLAELAELLGTAESLEIKTEAEYEHAAELLKKLKGAFKASEDDRKALADPYRKEYERINAGFKPVKQRYDKVEQVIKKAIADFRAEQRRKAEAEEAKLRDKQAKQSERLEERAKKAEEKGDERKANQLREQADAPVPQVSANVPGVEGVHTRTVWKWELVDASQVGAGFKVVDEKAIDSVVKSQGDRAEKTVGGIRVWSEEQVVSRAG